MPPQGAPHQPLILDTCVALNLYASRRLIDVVRSVPGGCLIADVVLGEALYVERGGQGDDAHDREPVELAEAFAERLIIVASLGSDAELLTFVDLLAAGLGTGEAATIALARHRQWVVATDDRRARRLAANLGVSLRWTLDLMRHWGDAASIDAVSMRAALTDIRLRASYVPGRAHPLKTWWDGLMGDPPDE